jgi:(E)-4-hydroxy-3-methylbut-2-enyl-diphosphate synthase
VRVSLTEDPVREVPVARALTARYQGARPGEAPPAPGEAYVDDLTSHARRSTVALRPRHGGGDVEIGGGAPIRVEVDLGPVPAAAESAAVEVAGELTRLGDLACEGLCIEVADEADLQRAQAFSEALSKRMLPVPLAIRVPTDLAARIASWADRVVLEIASAQVQLPELDAVPVEWSLRAPAPELASALDAALAAGRRPDLVSFQGEPPMHYLRLGVALLRARGLVAIPVALRHRGDPSVDSEAALLRAATDLGGPLCDGIGDLVSLAGMGSLERSVSLAYRILQGARQRTSWTEFISCPSCGRTLFDLEETTARIKERTQHLPGVKIAVMGCIVNGPGEMADADFGYVGSGVGRVDLYVGHQRVLRNLEAEAAPDRLVELIREQGRWVEPS